MSLLVTATSFMKFHKLSRQLAMNCYSYRSTDINFAQTFSHEEKETKSPGRWASTCTQIFCLLSFKPMWKHDNYYFQRQNKKILLFHREDVVVQSLWSRTKICLYLGEGRCWFSEALTSCSSFGEWTLGKRRKCPVLDKVQHVCRIKTYSLVRFLLKKLAFQPSWSPSSSSILKCWQAWVKLEQFQCRFRKLLCLFC